MTDRTIGGLKGLVALVGAVATLVVLAPVAAFSAPAVPTFTIDGTGYGHGVGLSQLGAVEAAKQGKTATQIINHYYTDVSLKKISTYRVQVDIWPNATATDKAKTSWMLRPGYVDGTLIIDGVEYPDNRYTFTAKDERVIVSWTQDGESKSKTLGASVIVKMGAPYDKTDLVQVSNTSSGEPRNNVRYRGYMIVTAPASEPDQVRLQNSVDVEAYLRGVLPRELGSYYAPAPAASEAQAIVARSYARLGRTALYTTTRSQVYGGHSYFKDEDARRANKPTALEESGSNSAIKATEGQHITYNGSVVRGYFSASNGPVTANVEDIWGTRYGYLRSVKDPYFKATKSTVWSETISGLKLASRIASRYSAPSGAGSSVWVTDVDISYGAGGHARGATIRWSNGSTTTFTRGEQVMLGFGLKSAQVKVHNSLDDAPVTYTKYEDHSSAISLVGPWKKLSIDGNSGGAIRTASTKGSYFSMRFKGEGIRWIGPKASSYGRAKVFIDGELVKTVDLYRSTTARQQTLFEIKGLDPAVTHRIKVLITPKSSGGYATVGLDRLDVINGAAVFPSFTDYKETSKYITRTGTWKTSTSASHIGGTALFTSQLNASATIKFKGNMVRWIGYTAPTGGRAKVYLNGKLVKTVSLKSSSMEYQKILYSASTLDPTKVHTLRIVTTTASGSTSAGKVTIDRIQVRNGSAVR